MQERERIQMALRVVGIVEQNHTQVSRRNLLMAIDCIGTILTKSGTFLKENEVNIKNIIEDLEQ